VSAFKTEFANGLSVSVDTTVSYGIRCARGSRLRARRHRQRRHRAHGNEDDGNLNFKKGEAFANAVRQPSTPRSSGGTSASSAAAPPSRLQAARQRQAVPPARTASAATWWASDGFVYASFEPMGRNLRVRFGRQ
jgi:hypothetical protein